MAIISVGSINIDLIYRVPHLPGPGETLASTGFERKLGGKGANQSIAAAKAGAEVIHCGAVGEDGADMVAEIAAVGADVRFVETVAGPTGNAVIYVDEGGENSIVLLEGSNGKIGNLETVLADVGPSDWVLLQNEVRVSARAAQIAKAKGARVVYSAAPFDAAAVAEVLPYATHLLVNEGENAALEAAGHALPEGLIRVITRGASGASWVADVALDVPAFKVEDVVDTTGAGDCFAGNLIAALDRGMAPAEAMRFAQAASAVQIGRPGAAPAMPSRAETKAFLERQ